MADAAKVNPETRMLIDGKLVEAESGKMFDNVNPATEEVLGQVADASPADMERAIAAARRAFDETDWSTNRELRKHCLGQLQDALEAEKEEMREQLILEVGCPRMLTNGPQLDRAVGRRPALPDEDDRRVRLGDARWTTPTTSWAAATPGASPRRRSASSAPSCPGTSRSR